MGTYRHGAYVEEADSGLAAPKRNEGGLHVIFGTAPVNMAAKPGKAANRLVIAESFEEAEEKLGYSEDFEKFTLCQAMDVYFRIFAVGPVVFCNVLDPEKHKRDNEEKEYEVKGGQARLEEGNVIPSSLVVKTAGGEPLADGADYITSFDGEGKLTVTFLSSGKGAGESSVKVASTSIDPDAVTEEDIIGGVDALTGKETGMELIRRVYPVCGKFPGLILAPGWSHKKNVAAVMAAKCKEINGVFRCECLVDLDTSEARMHTDCGDVKKKNGMESKGMIVLYPMLMTGGKKYYYSAIYGAMTAQTDADNGSIPTMSPSNRPLRVDSAVLEDGTELYLDQPEANALNGQGIVTVLCSGGTLRAWGNNTAAYPETKELKDRWINCRRAFSWWANSFITTCAEKVDSPANYRLIETIVDEENIRGNSYVQQGKFAGIRMEYDKAENSVEGLLEGKIHVRQYIAPYTPAEYILNTLAFDPSLLEKALGGQ